MCFFFFFLKVFVKLGKFWMSRWTQTPVRPMRGMLPAQMEHGSCYAQNTWGTAESVRMDVVHNSGSFPSRFPAACGSWGSFSSPITYWLQTDYMTDYMRLCNQSCNQSVISITSPVFAKKMEKLHRKPHTGWIRTGVARDSGNFTRRFPAVCGSWSPFWSSLHTDYMTDYT